MARSPPPSKETCLRVEIHPQLSITNLQERAAVVALFHEDLENGYPGYGQDGTQRQYQTDGVCPAGEHVVSVLGGAEVDTGEDQNHL